MGDVHPVPAGPDIETIIESRNAEALSEQIEAATDNLIGLGMERLSNFDLTGAAAHFQQLEDQVDVIDRKIAEKWPPGNDLDQVRESLAYLQRFAEGMKQFAVGTGGLLSRTPKLAADAFKKAGSLFREIGDQQADPEFDAFADFADCQEQAALGLEQLLRLNNDAAAKIYTRTAAKARILVESTLPPLLSKPDHSPLLEFVEAMAAPGLRSFIQAFDVASFRDHATSGDFDSALSYAQESLELAKQAVDGVPPDGPRVLRVALQCLVSTSEADVEITQAHILRERREWDPARERYKRARACLQAAAVQMAESPFPDAAAGMDSLLNQANNIGIWLRQCDRERGFAEETRQLKDEYSAFKEALSQVYSKMGIVINTNVDLQNMVQQTANITQEVKVRDAFSDLRAKASEAEIDPTTKSAIIKKAEEAIQLADHGATFLDRVKQIAEDIGSLVQKAGPAAAVLIPAAKAVGLALGIPLPL